MARITKNRSSTGVSTSVFWVLLLLIILYLLVNTAQVLIQQFFTPPLIIEDFAPQGVPLKVTYPKWLTRDDATMSGTLMIEYLTSTPPTTVVTLTADSVIQFVDRQGNSLGKSITLTLDTNATSVAQARIRHANLGNTFDLPPTDTEKHQAQIGIEHVTTVTRPVSISVDMENATYQFWRKVLGLIFGPAGVLLLAVGFILDQLKKRRDEEQKRREEQQNIDNKRSLERLRDELQRGTRAGDVALDEALLRDWLAYMERHNTAEDQKISNGIAHEIVEYFKRCPEWLLEDSAALGKLRLLNKDLSKLGLDKNEGAKLGDLDVVVGQMARGGDAANRYPSQDPFLFGFYLNQTWERCKKDQQTASKEMLDCLKRNIADFAMGVCACARQLEKAKRPHEGTLYKSLLQPYWQGQKTDWSEFFGEHAAQLEEAIKKTPLSPGTDIQRFHPLEIMRTWDDHRRIEKLIEKGELPSRLLWPLARPTGPSSDNDANYDFDSDKHLPMIMVNATEEDLRKWLERPEHHIIVGVTSSGKTTLRLHLEYDCKRLDRGFTVFFMPSHRLLYRSAFMTQLKCLAACVGNELFANLCERNTFGELKPGVQSAIARLLGEFGYDVAAGGACLFQPAPPRAKTDINVNYWFKDAYSLIKKVMDDVAASDVAPFASSEGEILDRIRASMKAAGHERLLVLIDNLDDALVSVRPERFAEFLQPWFEAEALLREHDIYFKMFLPPSVAKQATIKSHLEVVQGWPTDEVNLTGKPLKFYTIKSQSTRTEPQSNVLKP